MKVSELLANAESKGHITQYFGIREKEYQVVDSGKDKEKECVTPVTATTPYKGGRPPKDPLVFVSTNPTSTLNTPLRCSTRLKN
jgi:hypothetical protein